MAIVIVGVADYRVSQDPKAILITCALGSCIALSLHDPVAGIGGLLHFMLPNAEGNASRAGFNPAMYADTGIPMLLAEIQKLGANRRKLVANLAGGSQILDPAGLFNIGRRNHIAARNLLWKAGILVRNEAVGGSITRSFGLQVGSGQTWLKQIDASAAQSAGPSLHEAEGPFGVSSVL
jgi:chemotaxis protein CheD